MTNQDAPFLSIIQYAIAMQKTIDEVRKYTTFQQVNNAFNIYNGPSTRSVYDLSINLSILVYWEKNVGLSKE